MNTLVGDINYIYRVTACQFIKEMEYMDKT